ncbi:hypothetical protein KCP76_04635 [Salmonella enterica subsp. enterica serovar Weltevreden]|nr:hypothetical protein KCP76_04635 [Salmonella enterica subsp. enterica serovar Weltevreden]
MRLIRHNSGEIRIMAEIGIFVGTMWRNSLLVAEEAEAILRQTGSHSATVFEDPNCPTGSNIRIRLPVAPLDDRAGRTTG